jgi:hypothetical protein
MRLNAHREQSSQQRVKDFCCFVEQENFEPTIMASTDLRPGPILVERDVPDPPAP